MDNLKVIILLATYNGEKYLQEQLHSFMHQDFQNIQIFISDDGSTDKTLDIIQEFKKTMGENKVFVFSGPKQGYAKNFLNLFECVVQELKLDTSYYFAYADQDDIWYKDKISSALKALHLLDHSKPQLFCSRTRLINNSGEHLGFSNVFLKPPAFKNAILQNIAGGNTMVFNFHTFKLIHQTPKVSKIVAHDWWTYILVTGAQGQMIYSPIPSMDYRQHQKNLAGSNVGFSARLYRLKELLKGRLKHWNADNLSSLNDCIELLSIENQIILKEFEVLRKSNFPINLVQFIKLGLYRQTRLEQIAILVALILKRL